MVDLIPVFSTNVAAIGFESATSTLFVRFRSTSRVYRYRGVSESVYRAFLGSSSKGRFFAANIKDRYPYSRVA